MRTASSPTDEWFRLIVEAVPNAIIIVDRDRTITLVNCATEALFGYERTELMGQVVETLIPARFRADHPDDVAQFLADPQTRPMGVGRDLFGRRKDGSEMPIEIGLNPIETPDGPCTLASIIDLSDRKRAIETEQRMAALVESANDAIVTKDLTGIIRSWNPGAERLLGYPADDIIGESVTRLLPEDRQGEETMLLERIRNGQRVSNFESVRRRRDGSLVEVSLTISPVRDLRGRVVGASKIIRDISERKQFETRFRLVVEAAPSAMIMADKSGVITLVNRRSEDLFGYRREQLIGMSIQALIPERFRERHRGHVAGFFASATARPMGAGGELFGLRNDGTEVPIEIGLNPIDTSDGLFTLASIIDITERKRYQDELRRSNVELEQFAHVASHDLQEPLRMVASYTELLGERYGDQLDERAQKYIHYAVDGARRMQRLVADLLTYSRVGLQGKPLVPVNAAPVIDGVLTLLEGAIRDAGAVIEVGPLPVVLADEGQLHQLLQNLIGNAIKFRGDAPPHIVVEATRHNTCWRFFVRDNGIGIDMRHADRVFEMFQRLHERGRYDGSGIGLSVAKRILERHGGAIWLESEPGRGTTVHFTLLAADPAGVQ